MAAAAAAAPDTSPQQQQEQEQRELGGLHIGCAGYSYAHWRKGIFYPNGVKQESELRYYSQVFDTCEVNTTFYGTPGRETCRQWQQQVKSNAGFHFTLKMRQSVTHGDSTMPGSPGRSGGSSSSPAHERREAGHRLEPLSSEALEAEMPLFLERCEQLCTGNDGAFPPSLGAVLFQFPPSFEMSMAALERLARHLPGGGEAPAIAASAAPRGAYRFALEFRHLSWYKPEVYAFMRRQGWGLVQHALINNLYPDKNIPEVDEVTAPFVYLRLHGKKQEHAWNYTEEELRPYCEKIVAWRRRGLDCWVYFLNDAEGMAPQNAFQLLQMVRKACGEAAPSRPEDSQRQMMASYFSKGGAGAKRPAAAAVAAPATGKDKGKGEGVGEAEMGKKREGTAAAPAPPSPKRPRVGEANGGGAVAGAAAATPEVEGKERKAGSGSKQAQAAAGTRPLTAFFKKG